MRGREEPDPGPRPVRAGAADDARRPGPQTHDYIRHGTTSLFAALDVATGQVYSALHRRHRAIEFRKFLNQLDREVPAEHEVHLILDNYATHKTPEIRRWLLRHPRFHLHFTPTSSSWLNLVERFFAELTTRLLRRGVHRSVAELEADIRTWIDHLERQPAPLRLDQDRRTDPRIDRHLLPTTS